MEARQLGCEHRFRFVARRGSVVVAFLMCLGVFLLFFPATGSEVPSAVSMTNLARVDLATNGNAPPLDVTYLIAPGEVAEDAERDPLNAEFLTMLLLVVCFGLSVGWLLRNAQRQQALCSLAVVGQSLVTTCEELPFLGVFRL